MEFYYCTYCIFDSCSTLAATLIFQPQSNPLTTLISRKRDKIRQKSFSFEKSGEFGHTRKFYRHKFKRTLQLSFATDLIEKRTSGTLIIVNKLASLEATLVRNYDPATDRPTDRGKV